MRITLTGTRYERDGDGDFESAGQCYSVKLEMVTWDGAVLVAVGNEVVRLSPQDLHDAVHAICSAAEREDT